MATAATVLVNLEANVTKFTTHMKEATTSLGKLKQSIEVIKWAAIGNMATMAGHQIRRAFDFAEMGSKVLQVERSFHLVATSAGMASGELIKAMQNASQHTVEESDIMQKAIRGITEGLSQEQLIGLMKAATTASKMMGMDVSEAYGMILDSITALRMRGLKAAFPMIVDQEEAFEKLAKATGHTKDELSEYGKMQAIANTIIEENARLTKTMGENLDITTSSIQQAKAQLKDITETLSKGFLAVLMVATGVIQNFNAAFYLVASSFLSVASVITRVGAMLPAWAGGESYKNWNKTLEEMRDNAEKTAFDLNEQGNNLLKGAWGIVTGEKEGTGNVQPMKMPSLFGAGKGKTVDPYKDWDMKPFKLYAELMDKEDRERIERTKRISEMLAEEAQNQYEQIQEILGYERYYRDENARLNDEMLSTEERFYTAQREQIEASVEFEKYFRDESIRLKNEMIEADAKMASDISRRNEEQFGPLVDFANQIGDTFVNVFANMADSTKSFSDRVKDTFKSLADSVIAEISRMMMQWMLFGSIQGMGGFSKGSPVGGLLGLLGVKAFASGGIVTQPTMAMIGESGPEAVVPLNSKSMGGGDTYIYISAVDTQSFNDAIRRNPGSILKVIHKNDRENMYARP